MLAMREPGSRSLSLPHTVLWRSLRLIGELSLLATAIVLLARVWWFFELFANFRVQLVAVQLLLFFAYLVMRRPLWATAIGAASIINGIAVREYILPVGTYVADADSPAEIRVLNANVRASNTNSAGLIALVTAVEPDVIAVLEFTEHFADTLRVLDDAYPHQVLVPESSNFGIAVYSRWPFANAEVFDLDGFAAIDAQIVNDRGAWHLIAAHCMPPIGADLAALRNRQLEQLAEYVGAVTAPHIVVGDLNLAPFSPYFADFIATTGLSNALRGNGPSFTWPSFFPPLGIPIDYVLTSAEFQATDYLRGDDIGSDHLPVIVDVNRSRNGLD
jgi:endonuclease/exonuclease/phosphatase (EEP) superfamily protein YafD